MSENSEPPHVRRKATKRITSPNDDDDPAVASPPPLKRPRIGRSPDWSDENEDLTSPSEAPRPLARTTPTSNSRHRAKHSTKKKRAKVVLSDPESEEFDPVDEESDPEAPVDDDEYLTEPKNPAKRVGGGKGKGVKGKKKAEPKEIMAKDERKRPMDPSDATPAAKRPRTKSSHKTGGEVVVDVVGDGPALGTSPPKEEPTPAPKKSKLPPIKKNKLPMTANAGSSNAAGTLTPSVSSKAAPSAIVRAEEDSKLPAPIVGARKPTIVPASVDVDLTNPTMYAQLFKSGGGSTPSGFSRREKDEERRKELNRMREEAKAKRISEAEAAFDLQGQMDKITRFEERLKISRSNSLYPNYLGGALTSLQLGKKYYAGTDLEPEAREEGEM